LTLSIRPVRLKKSVYLRVPSDIVDLMSLEDNSPITLTLVEKNDRHLLVYSVFKSKPLENSPEPGVYALSVPVQQSTNRSRAADKP
jgi:hypothetical protein